jgi:hypothetical protein
VNVEHTLVLPRSLVIEMLAGVPTRRIDIFNDGGTYILQTTKHPKQNVTEFLDAFPKQRTPEKAAIPEDESVPAPDRVHVQNPIRMTAGNERDVLVGT